MAEFPVEKEFTETTRMIETTDPVHASIVNSIFQVLINNDNFLNRRVEGMKEIVTGLELTDSAIKVTSNRFTSNLLSEVLLELLRIATAIVTEAEDGRMTSDLFLRLQGMEEEANHYVHPTGEGSNHIPSGGVPGQMLVNDGRGSAVWGPAIYIQEEEPVNPLEGDIWGW